jgi:hypothetical protein
MAGAVKPKKENMSKQRTVEWKKRVVRRDNVKN